MSENPRRRPKTREDWEEIEKEISDSPEPEKIEKKVKESKDLQSESIDRLYAMLKGKCILTIDNDIEEMSKLGITPEMRTNLLKLKREQLKELFFSGNKQKMGEALKGGCCDGHDHTHDHTSDRKDRSMLGNVGCVLFILAFFGFLIYSKMSEENFRMFADRGTETQEVVNYLIA